MATKEHPTPTGRPDYMASLRSNRSGSKAAKDKQLPSPSLQLTELSSETTCIVHMTFTTLHCIAATLILLHHSTNLT